VAFPFATPSTAQVAPAFEEFDTVAVNVARWLMSTVAEVGATETVTLLITVTVANADWAGLDWLVAWRVTGLAEGRMFGAV
jgi:hypothetical protein